MLNKHLVGLGLALFFALALLLSTTPAGAQVVTTGTPAGEEIEWRDYEWWATCGPYMTPDATQPPNFTTFTPAPTGTPTPQGATSTPTATRYSFFTPEPSETPSPGPTSTPTITPTSDASTPTPTPTDIPAGWVFSHPASWDVSNATTYVRGSGAGEITCTEINPSRIACNGRHGGRHSTGYIGVEGLTVVSPLPAADVFGYYVDTTITKPSREWYRTYSSCCSQQFRINDALDNVTERHCLLFDTLPGDAVYDHLQCDRVRYNIDPAMIDAYFAGVRLRSSTWEFADFNPRVLSYTPYEESTPTPTPVPPPGGGWGATCEHGGATLDASLIENGSWEVLPYQINPGWVPQTLPGAYSPGWQNTDDASYEGAYSIVTHTDSPGPVTQDIYYHGTVSETVATIYAGMMIKSGTAQLCIDDFCAVGTSSGDWTPVELTVSAPAGGEARVKIVPSAAAGLRVDAVYAIPLNLSDAIECVPPDERESPQVIECSGPDDFVSRFYNFESSALIDDEISIDTEVYRNPWHSGKITGYASISELQIIRDELKMPANGGALLVDDMSLSFWFKGDALTMTISTYEGIDYIASSPATDSWKLVGFTPQQFDDGLHMQSLTFETPGVVNIDDGDLDVPCNNVVDDDTGGVSPIPDICLDDPDIIPVEPPWSGGDIVQGACYRILAGYELENGTVIIPLPNAYLCIDWYMIGEVNLFNVTIPITSIMGVLAVGLLFAMFYRSQ